MKYLKHLSFLLFIAGSALQAKAVCSATSREADSLKLVMEKTTMQDMHVLFITDTAATTDNIPDVLSRDYGLLTNYVKDHKGQILHFIAWYRPVQSSWIMEVGVVTAGPLSGSGPVQYRKVEGGNVVIAHMWGPYEEIWQAYVGILDWLDAHHAKERGNNFEMYINDPASVQDPSELETDLYQPIE